MKRTDRLSEAALSYQKRGWSIFPIKGKQPLVQWKPYQSKPASIEQIKKWWKTYPYASIGLVTGKISNLIVLDVDGEEGAKYIKDNGIPPTPCVKTSRGSHYYFKYPGFTVQNFAKKKGLDLRGDGGYVVLPPSKHPSGINYEWTIPPEQEEPAKSPGWVLKLITEKEKSKPLPETEINRLLKGVKVGERHFAATRLTGHWLGSNLPSNETVQLLRQWNKNNKPSLPESELDRMVNDFSIAKEKREKKGKVRINKYKEKAKEFLAVQSLNDYELYRKEFEPEQFWISDGILPKTGFVLFAAYKGKGKTTLTIQMCLKLIQGNTTFLKDFRIKDSPSKILYCYAENVQAELKLIRRTQQESIGLKLTEKQHHTLKWFERGRLDLIDRESVGIFKEIIGIEKPDIVILDPLLRFLAATDINKLQKVNPIFDTLQDIGKGCLWFFISHMRKPSAQDTGDTMYKAIGSSAFVNNCDTVITLDRANPHRDPLCSKMEIITRRARLLEPRYIKLNEENRTLEVVTKGEVQAQKGMQVEDIRDIIADFYHGQAYLAEIKKVAELKFKVKEGRVYNLLKEAQDRALITKETRKGGKYHVISHKKN